MNLSSDRPNDHQRVLFLRFYFPNFYHQNIAATIRPIDLPNKTSDYFWGYQLRTNQAQRHLPLFYFSKFEADECSSENLRRRRRKKEKCKRNSSSGVYLYRVDANFIICIIHSGKKIG